MATIGTSFGSSFGGLKAKAVKAVKPVKNKSSVGGGSVAGMPTAPKILKSATDKPVAFSSGGGKSGGGGAGDGGAIMSSLPNMMSTKNGAAPGYIKKGSTPMMSTPENMMSTKDGAAPGYIKKGGEPMMSVAGKTTPTQTTAAGKTTSNTTSKTTASSTSSSVVDRNRIAQQNMAAQNTETAPTDTTANNVVAPEAPTTTEGEETPPDYVGQDIALTQAEYMQQSKEQEEFMRNQRSVQTQIDTLSGEMQQLQSSELIRKTSDDLDKLKHNIAYLGKQGQPGESAVKMEAISKQVADAERVFMNLKKLETDKESMRTLGLEYDANAFERQMVQMQNDLNTNVNMAIQEALNGLNAAEMKGEMDTVEDVEKLRGTLFQNLDKAIAGKVVANATDRKLIIDRYNQVIAEGEAYVKNKSVVNKDLSAAMGYYIDGNGNPLLNAQGGTIAMPKEAPMEPIFDKDSGNLLTFSTGPDGKIITTVQKILAGQQAAGDPRKQASDGTYYRTNAQGQLETSGSAGVKKLSSSEQLAWSKALNAGEVTQAEYNMAVYGNSSPMGAGAPVSGYTGPSYTAASVEQVQKAFTQVVSQGDGSRGGQCGSFVNNYLQDMGIDRLFKDPIDVKKAVMNSTEATVGSIAIMDSPTQPQYGHVGIVTSVNADGTVTIKQSNKGGNETVFTSKKNISDIYGFFDPQIPMNEALMGGGTTSDIAGGNIYNKLNAEDRGLVDMISTYDAPLPNSRNKNYSKIMAAVAEINPDFDAKKYPSQQKFMNNWTSGTLNTNKMALNTALGHIGTLIDSTTNLGNTKFKPFNQAKNWIADVTGNPSLVGAGVSSYAVASEIAKVFKGGASPTEDEIKDWKKLLNTNMSPAQWTKALSESTYLLSSRAKEMARTYKSAMGKEAPLDDYLGYEAQNTITRLGMDINKFAGIESQTSSLQYTGGYSTNTAIGRRQAAQQ